MSVPPAVRVPMAGEYAGVMLSVRQQESCWPDSGAMTVENVMVPAKLPMLARLRSAATVPPLTMLIESGTAAKLKSWPGTWTVIIALWLWTPLEPVTVSV